MLTRLEAARGALLGQQRHLEAVYSGKQHRPSGGMNDGKHPFEDHIQGACAEQALAKHYGVFWPRLANEYRVPDVGDLYVRYTRHENGHLLLDRTLDFGIRKRWVLVTGQVPEFTLRGWIWSEEALDERYWRSLEPGMHALFCVPQDVLHELPPPQREA